MSARAALTADTAAAWAYTATLTVGPSPAPRLTGSLPGDYAALAGAATGSSPSGALFAVTAAAYALCLLASGLRARRRALRAPAPALSTQVRQELLVTGLPVLPRVAAVPLAAGFLAGVLAACAGGAPLTPQAEALAYMETHPVPATAGMTAGVILTADVKGFAGAAATEAGCPASLLSYTSPAAGSPPGCGAWSLMAETAAGRRVTVSCGSITARQACPMLLDGNEGTYVPGPGDLVLFRSGGRVTVAAGIRLVTFEAVPAIPDPDQADPFVTSPAGGQD